MSDAGGGLGLLGELGGLVGVGLRGRIRLIEVTNHAFNAFASSRTPYGEGPSWVGACRWLWLGLFEP